jgi:hypothetical protein
VKVLFSLRHSFAIRNFEPVLRVLAEQGHEIHLSFLSAGKAGGDAQAQALADRVATVTFGRLAERKQQRWFHFRRRLRFMVDNLRYRLPMYDDASKLRARALRRLPESQQRIIGRKIFRRPWLNRLATRALLAIEWAVPTDEVILAEVRKHDPDLIIVSPLVDFGSDQVDYIKAGHDLGIATALVVNSWDNLTNKGLMRVVPDRVYVWNETQLREAVEYHGAPANSVEVTGAPNYDRWFERQPSVSAEDFQRCAGLDPQQPYLLYLCSSPFIAEHEYEFVQQWIAAVRSSDDPALRNAGILVRPHPENRQPWRRLEGARCANVAVWPPAGANPVDRDSQADYFDSIYHSSAVVGINSSGLIEAGIVGRPVHTILDPDFAATQSGTIHFRYLVSVGGGLLRVANGWQEHLQQLRESLQAGGVARDANRGFVEEFVRPLGLDKQATPIMAESLVRLGSGPRPAPSSPSLLQRVLGRAVSSYAARMQEKSAGRAKSAGDRLDDRAAVLQTVENLSGPDAERIILGPWVGDVRSEVLYWIPFLRWAAESHGWDRDKLVVVTRGGAGEWYRELAPRCVEILDYLGVDELAPEGTDAAALQDRQSRGRTDLDREILRIAKQDVGAKRVKSLHPTLMYRLFVSAEKEPANAEFFHEFAVYRRFPEAPASGLLDEQPEAYVAVGFSFNPSFPDTMENRRFVASVVEQLQAHSAVVLLNPSVTASLGCDAGLETRANVHRIDHLTGPNRMLALQAEAIAGARAFVGSHAGVAYAAPFLGVEAVIFHSELRAADAAHLNFAVSVLSDTDDTGDLTAVQADQTDLVDRTLARLAGART